MAVFQIAVVNSVPIDVTRNANKDALVTVDLTFFNDHVYVRINEAGEWKCMSGEITSFPILKGDTAVARAVGDGTIRGSIT